MFIIINWASEIDVEFVREDTGEIQFFNTKREATNYAEKELNFSWEIIEIT